MMDRRRGEGLSYPASDPYAIQHGLSASEPRIHVARTLTRGEVDGHQPDEVVLAREAADLVLTLGARRAATELR